MTRIGVAGKVANGAAFVSGRMIRVHLVRQARNGDKINGVVDEGGEIEDRER
jgi:hypothetical protein